MTLGDYYLLVYLKFGDYDSVANDRVIRGMGFGGEHMLTYVVIQIMIVCQNMTLGKYYLSEGLRLFEILRV